MQFNSLVFVVFMACFLPPYLVLRGSVRGQNRLLLVGSYVFYGAWDWRFLVLLAVSTIVDFMVGIGLSRQPGSKRLLLVSLVVNLGILGIFKYFDFFVKSAAALLEGAGLSANLPLLEVALPVGISFYTFQTIAYTYSVYKGETPATRDFIAFAVYVAYFPQLVAGPIERARKLLPQIQGPRVVTVDVFKSGCLLVLQGLFKKIAIADAVAGYVDAAFADPGTASSSTLVLGVYMFALQIYGDFSGYTDIARGVSRALGIELIVNFRQPYLAANITDFWRRWHMSLSTWLREHIYIPLGGNRRGTLMTYRNLMLTMLLGGLWHGAGWTFVIWGGLHGVYLAVHRFWMGRMGRDADTPCSGGRRLVGWLVTFHLVCFAWIFFRARHAPERGGMPDLQIAWQVITGIGALDFSGGSTVPFTALLLLLVALLIDYLCVVRDRQTPLHGDVPLFVRWLVYGAAVVMMIVADSPGGVPFIYFQF